LAKISASGKVEKREDGKVLKPEGWTPPDIKSILKK
jgi:predicted HAD superfamily Cof-like phosphohydrolase